MKNLGAISANLESQHTCQRIRRLGALRRAGGRRWSEAKSIAQEKRLGPTVSSILSGRPVYNLSPERSTRKGQPSRRARRRTDMGRAADYLSKLGEFISRTLRNYGCFDKMLGAMRRVPLRTRVGASTATITGAVVPESHVKSVSKLTLTAGELEEIKVAAILVVTKELARFSQPAAGDLFAVELTNAISVATDERFVSILTTVPRALHRAARRQSTFGMICASCWRHHDHGPFPTVSVDDKHNRKNTFRFAFDFRRQRVSDFDL